MISRFYLKGNLSFKELILEFGKGLTVFSGASGSGKSILMESILTSLSLKNSDCDVCETIIHNNSIDLYQMGIDDKDELVFRRIKKDKIRYFLNDQVVSKNLVKDISLKFTKHLHLKDDSEFSSNALISVIDSYLCLNIDNHSEVLNKYQNNYKDYKNACGELLKVEEEEQRVNELKEFAKFEIEKIEKIDPKETEYEELLEIKKRLSKKDKIEDAINKAKSIFDYDSFVSEALSLIDEDGSFFDDAINELREIFEDTLIKLDDMNNLDIETILDRLQMLSELIKRHGSIKEALNYKHQKKIELEKYENIEVEKKGLQDKINGLLKGLNSDAIVLTKNRKDAVVSFKKEIDIYLKKLFLKPSNIILKNVELNSLGKDHMQIKMGKTDISDVSTGEFNRFRLAFLAVCNKISNQDSTIIFLDEIDSNLSGEESMSVAKVLKELSYNHQIFAISHHPQLTSIADTHFLVYKEDDISLVRMLDKDIDRIEEIARTISGDEITKKAREFAKTLLLESRK